VYLCHSECILGNRPLLDALVAIKAFLDLHPRDVLTLIFESYVSGGDVAAAFEAAGLLPTLHAQDVNQPWPALGAMGDTGRRLVVFTNRDAGATPWYHDQWAYTFENPWSAKTRTDLSCDVDRGHPSNSLYTLNHFASNPFPDPEEAALTNSNPFFVDQAQKCWTERNHLPNFPTVDFYDLGDLFAVVRTLNGLDADPAP
jgi:hypothetical protein